MRILFLLTLNALAVGHNVDLICNGRINGLYATSTCSNKYIHCNNGQVTNKTCPLGLVFDPDSNECTIVEKCRERTTMDCENREDGRYAFGCTTSFFFCSNGVAHSSMCQFGLYYDVDRDLCDHKFRVKACGGHPEVEREPITRLPTLVPTYPPHTMKRHAKVDGYIPVSADPVLSCQGRSHGAYPLGKCLQQYLTCDDDLSRFTTCATGEVFDGLCVSLEKVSECKYPSTLFDEGLRITDCLNRQDGYYGSTCDSNFAACSSGILHLLSCPSFLVFNESKGYCDYPTEECSQKFNIQSSAGSTGNLENSVAVINISRNISKDCKGKKNGFYSNGCSSTFVSCVEGIASIMKCPSSLVFNEKEGYCDYPGSCNGEIDDKSTGKVPMRTHPVGVQPLKSSSMSIDCEGRKDGYYSRGCSPEFVSCSEGIATYMKCPSSLVFNEKEGYCDYPGSCNGEIDDKSTGKVPMRTYPVGVQPLKSSSMSIDCEGRKDGYYSRGCSPEFVSCSEGIATYMKCPSSLVFNEKEGYCDYPGSCNGEIDDKSTGKVPMRTHPVGVQPLKSSSMSIDCEGKKDGYYSRGCSPEFVSCSEGIATYMKCPSSLVFNEKEGYCDYPGSCNGEVDDKSAGKVPMRTLPVGVQPLKSSSMSIDCEGRKDGYYSRGCSPEFVSCSEGIATYMKCPSSLVFNEKEGYCDYPGSCNGEIDDKSTGKVPMRTHPVGVQPLKSSSMSIDCEGKKDGYYSRGCSPEFVSCSEGIATYMKCPSSLVFNEKEGYCDYPGSCNGEIDDKSTGKVPMRTHPVGVQPLKSSSMSIDCEGKKDGYYSRGCSPEFVSCSEGIATYMKCPSSLVFNEKEGYCDYPGSCNGEIDDKSTGKVPMRTHPVGVQPLKSSSMSIDCEGKKDGYYSRGCSPEFVSCSEGIATYMKCPSSLVFNEKEGYCDYPGSCNGEIDDKSTGKVPMRTHPVGVQPLKSSSMSIDCEGKKDGYYSRGCSPEFVSCSEGIATYMKCPSSLVFNEKEGYCDYPGSCNGEIDDKSTGKVPMRTYPVGVQPLKSSSMSIDCEGKKDGYYSRGCSPEFVSCSEGIATYMKCPSSLVFNEKEGYCDYPGSCNGEIDDKSTGKVPMRTYPVGVQPLKSSSMSIDCEGKKDGYYSRGCSPEFVSCSEGIATYMKCPSSLVFNEKEGYCDYPGSCNGEIDDKSTGKVPMRTHPVGVQPLKSSSMSIDCEGKKDGYYSRGCSPEFVSCSEGIATYMKCPSSLVFNEKEGYCDYPGSCNGEIDDKSTGKVPMRTYPVGVQPLKSSSMSIDCEGKKDGYYSRGCSPEFVSCSEGIATYMKCPSSLVFNEKEGYCDYPGSCNGEVDDKSAGKVPMRTLPVGVQPLKSSSMSIDCEGKKDGYYSRGCSPEFVSCSEGIATYMKCPSSLVFNEKEGYCDYPGSCNSEVVDKSSRTSHSRILAVDDVISVSQVGCIASMALGKCMSKFKRCRNGRFISAQCPDPSLFDEKLLLCVYDLPDCRADRLSIVQYPADTATPTTGSASMIPSDRSYAAETYFSESSNYGLSGKPLENLIAKSYLDHLPLNLYDPSNGRGHVNHKPINFEERSVLAGDRAKKVLDIFDGYVSPWLWPGIDRVFVPSFHDRRGHGSHSHSDEDITSRVSDDFDEKVSENEVDFDMNEFNPREAIMGDSASEYDDEIEEGSGENTFVRKRRSSQYSQMDRFSICTSSNSPGLVPSGMCHQNFIFCKSVGAGLLAACPVGDLFDSKVKKCVISYVCHDRDEVNSRKQIPKYYNVSFAKDRTIDANSVPLYSYWKKPRCLDNTFYVMECDENFMKCSNGHFYPMKCPEGLVFNRVSHQCDYPSTVPTCTEVLPSKLVNHKSHIKHPTDRTASGDPIVPVISGALIDHSRNKLHQAVEDLCSSLHDGMHSDGCTASFVICRHGKIQASMNCPQGTWFDEERAMCDYREKVAACSGALHYHSLKPFSVLPTTTKMFAPNLTDECNEHPEPFEKCSSKFLICSNGIYAEFYCVKPLVYNRYTKTCDSREHVPDCQNLEERHPTTGVEVSVSNKVDHSCVYNKKRPAFALGFCGRTYGVCSEDGIQSHQECSVGFLFDSHLNTCVPDEQCGHGRVKDILNEMLSVPFVATASTTENMFKNVRKKDGRCRNSVDGSLKPLGRCRSSYIKCVDGVAVIEPCSTTAEVFSSAVDKCVLRINAPECYEKPQRSRASQLSTSGGVAAFCRSRADGLYRDPADCSGILQCFGGDVFEYPSCSTGLVFNEESGKCDFRSSVMECRISNEETNLLKGCRGASHGDFVADEADCLQFYRCVWDRLELMRCPSGTVFNPKLSVCDWPTNVPQCSAHRYA